MIQATPSDYRAKLFALQPGDTLVLAAGNYGVDANGNDTSDPPGLPFFDMHGTADAPITVTGPATGPRPVLLGRSTHNTVRFDNASYIVVRNLVVDGRDRGGAGIASQGLAHHITIEGVEIRGVGDDQQTVGIAANSGPAWNWVIRGNTIIGAGTGMYLGNSDGASPFVAGLIEHNVVRDTIGYNIQVKHQVAWSSVPSGMPTGATATVIRHNVFSKTSTYVSPDGARPCLLVGDQPPSGPGSQNRFEIYGNFFWQNPTEALFQAEGRVAFYGNVMVNDTGSALRIQTHNGQVRDVRIFGNTVLAQGTGISVSGGSSGTTQLVTGNAVFAASAITVSGAGASQAGNVTGTRAAAGTHLNNPDGAPGAFDPHPKSGALQGAAIDTQALQAYTDWNRDFNGASRAYVTRGAYETTGANPGWLPKLSAKP